ncbi:MAG: histidine kinase [Flavobacteriales bacterium]
MKRPILWSILVLAAMSAAAQYPDTRTFELRVGQQRPHVTCLGQDELGLIWAGSDLGVMRTDGERTELVFRTEGSSTTSIARQGSSMLAALSDGRIVRCDGLSTSLIRNDTLAVRSPVRCMYAADGDRLWLGLYGAGVRVIHEGKEVAITSIQGLPDDHVHAIAPYGIGSVAVATDLGIAVCDATGKVLRTITESEGLADNLVTALQSDRMGGLWVGTDRGGVIHIASNGRMDGLHPAWPHGPVNSVALVDSMLFVATADHGVLAFATGYGLATYVPPALVRNGDARPQELLRARDGSAWWCDGSDRLYRSDPSALIAPEHEGFDLTHITALCSDGGDRILFATPDGLFEHKASFPDAEKFTRMDVPLEMRAPIVCLHADASGGLWAGTMGMGVFHFHPGSHAVHHFTTKDGLVNDNVLAIGSRNVGGRSEVWFATLGGACVYSYNTEPPHAGGFKAVRIPGNGFLYDVLPMPDGTVYLATDGTGVVRIANDGSIGTFGTDNSRTFYSLCAATDGTVWACGPGTGLCKLEAGGIRSLGRRIPPFDGDVYAIASYAGRILALGQSGLAALDANGSAIVDLAHEYGLEGVQAELNATCTDGSGALWLATDRGLLRLRPAAEVLNADVPTVITALRWGNEQLPLANCPDLRHDQNFITIQFTGLRYAAPDHIRFEYRLAGFDDDVRTTRDREVTWSRLPPGQYRFDMRAALGNNPMPADWTSLAFTILQPWWLQWWALVGWALLTVLVVVLMVRARDSRLRYRDRMEKEKARFHLEALRSQVNPHFLFNSFNTLIGLIEEDKEKAVEHTEQLSDFFRNILQVRDKDLIPLREELPLLYTYFNLEKRRFGDRIALHIRIPEEELDRSIPPLTLQLLVENAIKHNVTDAGQPLVVEVIAEGGVLRVRNPYRPRATSTSGTGYGLESIRQRYELLTDRPVQLEVTESTFEVRIPLIDKRT